jgi:bacterioferritin-associated ferredoxin
VNLDEEVCICFHVTRRKVLSFIRVHSPVRAGQLADCFGAGTGCGWCRPFLRRIFEQTRAGDGTRHEPGEHFPADGEYRRLRGEYLERQGGKESGGPAGDPPQPD